MVSPDNTSPELDRLLQHALGAWSLEADGALIETPSSWVVPARLGAEPAMLKLMKDTSDEEYAAGLLAYYDGDGAVRVLASDDRAVLLERASGTRSLVAMATSGRDDEAATILADITARLHAPRARPAPATLWPLEEWFSSLFEHEHQSDLLGRCATMARRLLAAPTDTMPLHGDMHHGNVLDGGERGWLAIDPKALLGERTYDIANQLCNPYPHAEIVHDADRFRRLAALYGDRLDIEPQRILDMTFAYTGLSASWDMDDGDPDFALTNAEILAPVTSS
ncbi:MAG: aminoglycoside phosphotransferase family protein [Pseudomonadota bacterium]